MLSQSEQKKLVGETAINRLFERGLIKNGTKIGLGTGSTAMPGQLPAGGNISTSELTVHCSVLL